jgi:hypothetical protein
MGSLTRVLQFDLEDDRDRDWIRVTTPSVLGPLDSAEVWEC